MTEGVSVDALIDAILHEMERVWGEAGLSGEPQEYAWLEENFGITEEEDVRWQLILQYQYDDLSDEDQEDDELMAFLDDEDAVEQFLKDLLHKYESNSKTYSR